MGYNVPVGEGLTGRVVEKGEGDILNYNVEEDNSVVIPGTENKDPEEESAISVPIFIGEEVKGAITVGKFEKKFNDNDMKRLNAFARQAEIAMKRDEEMDNLKESKMKLKQKKNKIEELHYAVHKIEKCKDKEEIYHLTTNIAENILDFDIAEFMIKKGDELVVTARSNDGIKGENRIGIDEGIAGRTYNENKSYIIKDLHEHSRSEPTNDEYRSGISVPISEYGVFQAISTEEDKFDENDLELAEILISHVKERLKNISNEKSIERKSEKIERLHKFAVQLESCRESDRVFELVKEAGENILGFDICRTYVPKDNRLLLKTASEENERFEDHYFSLDDSIAGRTYKEKEVFINKDMSDKDEIDPFKKGYRSGISLPVGDQGVFQAVSEEKDAFTEEDVKLSKLLIDHSVEALNRIETESREEFLLTLLRHDLKNKNNITKGYISLAKDSSLSDEQISFLDKASKSCEESMRLIRKVGMLSKIDKEDESEKIELRNSINSAIDNLNKIADENGITIEYDVCSCSVEAGTLLKEALNNIIENCIKHSEGSIVKIRSEKRDDDIKLTIEDDGKGIDDDEMKKIFQRGYKGKKSGGLGIGMYLVRNIISNYDGEITLEDSDLGGARFQISLNKA